MNHIFLYGPPGTGKSTVGKEIAGNLKLPFVDLDRIIDTNAGKTIPQIMEMQGEPAFRDLETSTLKTVVGEISSVIALGDGALLRDENRALAESGGQVLLLMAELPTLLHRLHNDSGKRPLLTGELGTKLSALLARREAHYNSFPLKIHVDNKTAEENANQAQLALGRHHLFAMGEYDVIVGQASSVPADRSYDSLFHELMADTEGKLDHIYSVHGIRGTERSRAEQTAFLGAHPRGKEGRVRYDLEGQFGTKPELVRERFGFYIERFAVRVEP